MPFEFIIIIIVVSYLRKSLRTAITMPEWNKNLLWFMYASIALIIPQFFAKRFDVAVQWIAIIMLSWLMYIIHTNDKFRTAKFLITAITPYIVASLINETIKLISTDFYNHWGDWLDASKTFAIIWGIGTWLVTRRQQKELVKAREKTREEEENNKVITAMKAELEVQVAERTSELTKQKEELEVALDELKSTQAQLIQSEKMASLGELTAGIAHEIQNPLNFVNNFSEVNNELIEEMNVENDISEIKVIANNIKQNNEKISFHGKRADAIVKGMLQHSRKNTGQKELTDINALADEYLRLSYHGLRAKNKNFNANFKTDFDDTIGKINIVPQDVGRVLLNLFNNAFYAVSEKKKTMDENLSAAQAAYQPTVTVTTKRSTSEAGESAVSIIVKDNGNGIPQNIIGKIFQPFFTTKPTGQGTGLGLSMSYDIITKEHGGTITAERLPGITTGEETAGTAFNIELPC